MPKFKPGQIGNPAGRPKGARHQATLVAQALIDGEAEALARTAIEKALAGDQVCLRVLIERLVPPRKVAPIRLTLPNGDISRVTEAILRAVTAGMITPGEGKELGAIVEQHRRAVETTELEARIRALEERGMK